MKSIKCLLIVCFTFLSLNSFSQSANKVRLDEINIELKIEQEKTKQLEVKLQIEKDKTRQLELEIEFYKLKNNL